MCPKNFEFEILNFVQDNQSHSYRGVIRAIHYQRGEYAQAKLVRVLRGRVLDVAVDLRADSDTFGKWESVVLSESNHKQFWVPPGFAHGFLVLSDFADFEYKCTDYYDPKDEGGIVWNDPTLGINWPTDIEIVLSEKDKVAGSFEEYQKK